MIQQMKHKAQLGQFYTTNYEYILKNMHIPADTRRIIEPFAGNGDLLKFVQDPDLAIEMYDIDPKNTSTVKRDTLTNPPDYSGTFVLTNPPYLARNKSKIKDIYDKYDCNDLYKCFIMTIIANPCSGGIIIVPLNFISSIRKADIDLRKRFLETYTINVVNIFEEQVFDDTSYAVCSIWFVKNTNVVDNPPINLYIYPSGKQMSVALIPENNYSIGGEIYNLPMNAAIVVQRATKCTDNAYITNITVKCIDDSIDSQLGFSVVADDKRVIDCTPNLTFRSYATLVINKKISIDEQHILVQKMNNFIKEYRAKYNSLFLTNYRESNTIARKRISFELAFRICNYVLAAS